MNQLLRSLMKLDQDLGENLEFHIFLDGAISESGTLAKYALQLISCIKDTISEEYPGLEVRLVYPLSPQL